jgi:hypothetical protein
LLFQKKAVEDGAAEDVETVAEGSSVAETATGEVAEAVVEAVVVVAAAEIETKADLEKALRHARNTSIYCYTIFNFYIPCCRA